MLKPVEILVAIISKLRSAEGCAWDREQTHASLRGALLEECHELIEAIDSHDDQAMLEELGDLLLHVVFHAQIAAERQAFDWEKVCSAIAHKMIQRHPHVFRPFPTLNGHEDMSNAKSPKEILSQWEKLKAREKAHRDSLMDGIPPSLPALARAQKLQEKAARVGFDWPDPTGAREKITEELAECDSILAEEQTIDLDARSRLEMEIGDLLFSIVNWARKHGLDAELALASANRKFEKRFRQMEIAGINGKNLLELEELWQQAKAQDK